jgi:hypothetical protein
MYRNKVIRYVPLIILIPLIWQTVNLYFGSLDRYVLFLTVLFYGITLSFILYAFIKTEDVLLYLNKYGIENAPKEYRMQNGKKYTGIVIIHNNYKDKKAMTSYLASPMLLIEYLKRKSIPFKLVVDPDYKGFEKLVADPNCNKLYIVGHGRLYRLIIGPNKEDTIWYKDFIGYPPKDKVVQLHCNHRDWYIKNRNLQSLTDILNAKTDFKQKGCNNQIDLRNYLLKLVLNNEDI